MDRSHYYPDSASRGGSSSRPSANRDEYDAQNGSERLPPILPSAHSNAQMGRSDRLPPLQQPRLPPITDNDVAPYASYRPSYPSVSDRSAVDALRRPGSPRSLPAGMVSADYMHPRRSPPYYPTQGRHPASYRQDAIPTHPSSHMPHHFHYDLQQAHPHHPSELQPVSAATPVKRPRVSLACLACRNRKSRCDGIRPTCKTCATMSKLTPRSPSLIQSTCS